MLLLSFVTLYIAIDHGSDLFQKRIRSARNAVSILDLWTEGHYAEVNALAEKKLQEHPLDLDALLFAGYSRFYLAISRLSVEERNTDIDYSIAHLRLLLAKGGTPHIEKVHYLLGKAYLLKGAYWADQAMFYLRLSIDSGYISDDSYEFIGKAYSELGDFEQAYFWYQKAAESHPTDRLLLTLGEEAFKLGRYDEAATYYHASIDGTQDESLKKRGLSQLGQFYYDVGNYSMAKEVIKNLVSMEPGNPDYQFLLGEIYHELGLEHKARIAWHIVTRINPDHVSALHRLYD